MQRIMNIAELESLYGEVNPRSVTKVMHRLTPLYRAWIEASRFVVLSTVGPEGTDCSPRGDDGPVVAIEDAQSLLLPDWRGNNRLDSLRNILRDDRVSLMFMVPGVNNVVRINGRAVLSIAPHHLERFAKKGRLPQCVVNIRIGEIYFQCAKALMRAGLWAHDGVKADVPTAGAFVKEVDAAFDADGYDAGYTEYAKSRFW